MNPQSVNLASATLASIRLADWPHTRWDATDFDNGIDRSKVTYTFEDSESQLYVPIAVLECRGCEIISFDPKVTRLSSLSIIRRLMK